MEKQIAKLVPQSGGNQLKTLEQFKQLCESEYHVKHNAMVEEYRTKKDFLIQRRDRQVEEYKFLQDIMNLNTLQIKNEVHPAAIMAVEKELAGLDYETIAASFPLDYWRIQFGENMIVPVLCEVVSYFLRQFQVKEMLSDVQIMQLVIKLLAAQPKLRVLELVFILNKALAGEFGDKEGTSHFQRIGIDTLLGWITRFYESSAAYLECKVVNNKPTESRGESPWLEQEKKIKQYEAEQREKKLITEKIWGIEKRNREVQDHKEKVLADGQKG
jgi:hypothetical protein